MKMKYIKIKKLIFLAYFAIGMFACAGKKVVVSDLPVSKEVAVQLARRALIKEFGWFAIHKRENRITKFENDTWIVIYSIKRKEDRIISGGGLAANVDAKTGKVFGLHPIK